MRKRKLSGKELDKQRLIRRKFIPSRAPSGIYRPEQAEDIASQFRSSGLPPPVPTYDTISPLVDYAANQYGAANKYERVVSAVTRNRTPATTSGALLATSSRGRDPWAPARSENTGFYAPPPSMRPKTYIPSDAKLGEVLETAYKKEEETTDETTESSAPAAPTPGTVATALSSTTATPSKNSSWFSTGRSTRSTRPQPPNLSSVKRNLMPSPSATARQFLDQYLGAYKTFMQLYRAGQVAGVDRRLLTALDAILDLADDPGNPNFDGTGHDLPFTLDTKRAIADNEWHLIPNQQVLVSDFVNEFEAAVDQRTAQGQAQGAPGVQGAQAQGGAPPPYDHTEATKIPVLNDWQAVHAWVVGLKQGDSGAQGQIEQALTELKQNAVTFNYNEQTVDTPSFLTIKWRPNQSGNPPFAVLDTSQPTKTASQELQVLQQKPKNRTNKYFDLMVKQTNITLNPAAPRYVKSTLFAASPNKLSKKQLDSSVA